MESLPATNPNPDILDLEPLVYEGISLEPLSTKPSFQVSQNTKLNDCIPFHMSSSPNSNGTFDNFDFLQDSNNMWLSNDNSATFADESTNQELINQPSNSFSIEPEPKPSISLERFLNITDMEHEGHMKNTSHISDIDLQGNGDSDNKDLQEKITKGPWSEDEDRLLIGLVNPSEAKQNWTKIAKSIPRRLGKQCRDRWENHLRPDIKKGPWSKEEEMHLIKLHKEMGGKWSEIARIKKDRSENNIKNHWYATKRKRNKDSRDGMNYDGNVLQEYIRNLSSASSHEHQNETEDMSVANDSASKELESIAIAQGNDANVEIDQDLDKPYIPLGLVDDQHDMEVEYHQDPSSLNTPSEFDKKKEMDFFSMLFDDLR